MKIFRNLIILSAVILAFSSVNISAQSTANSETERLVQKKIYKLTDYGVFDHITFTVDGSTVTLNGKVANARNKKDAKAYVEDVPGVSRVINNIEVLPLSNFDDSIRRNLYASLSNHGGLSRYLWTVNPSVRLIVSRGHVTLEGYVANKGDYHAMNIVAHGVSGVFSVKNNLIIDNGKAR
jgi:hyperosmotically inducible protein